MSRTIRFFMPFVAAVSLCAQAGAAEGEAGAEQVSWNAQVSAGVLSTDSLLEVAESLPAWKARQMTWPGPQEIETYSVEPGYQKRAECVKWLRKFLKPECIPDGIHDHLVAMKQWGQVWEKKDPSKASDAFIVRYRLRGLVFQIFETPFNVVVTAGGAQVEEPVADHKQFILDAMRTVLREGLYTEGNTRAFTVMKGASPQSPVTSVCWTPDYCITNYGPGSVWSVSGVKVAEIGARSIDADSDGRFVRFDIRKDEDGAGTFRDPYKPRF